MQSSPCGTLDLIISYNRTNNTALLARAIEFTEEDILPGRQAKLSVDDRDRLRWSDQAGFQMSVAVAVLPVMEPHTLGDQLL